MKSRGYVAIDADWEGYSRWVNRVSSEVVVDPPYPVPPGWLDQFAWRVDVDRVQALGATTNSGVRFLCGGVENELDVWDYFDHVACLVIDDKTLRHRLATRTTNEFGKHPDQLEAALKTNALVEERYRRLGATIIDATQSLDVVVREVLAIAGLDRQDQPSNDGTHYTD
jgi:hypothetical protein